MTNITWLALGVMICAALFFRRQHYRDYYVVIREFRIIQPNEFGKGKTIESSNSHHFDDFAAAKTFLDLHNTYAATPTLFGEDTQNINYLYAVPAYEAKKAALRFKKGVPYDAKLLAETPFSILAERKRWWDDERKVRAEVEAFIKENETP